MAKLNNKQLAVLIGLVVILVVVLVLVFQEEEVVDLRIGVIQIVEHPALDGARQGFVDVLTEHGYIEGENVLYDYQNAQGDMANANTIAQKFASDRPDMILAIATPTSQAVASEIEDIPILITAVTDPVDAGLVESMEKPNTNVTGTTDLTPVARQLELLLKFVPEAENIGIVYNAGESNSVVQAEISKSAAEDLGLNIIEATADSSATVLAAAESLVNRVDALYVFTDNTVVSALESVIKVAEDNQLALIVGEEDSVVRGGLATEGLNYYELGRQTAYMALRIIEEGEKPENMPVESQEVTRLVINEAAAEAMGIEIPAELREQAAEIYTD